jgi:flagellar hook-basal body complex protein FliE
VALSSLTKLDTPPLQNGRPSDKTDFMSDMSSLLKRAKANASAVQNKTSNTDSSQSDDFNRWLTNIVDTINTDLENIDTMLASMDARITAIEALVIV